jgi:hypothetical protein
VLSASLGSAPLNVSADNLPVVTFRDPLTKVARSFRRKVDDLSPRFRLNRDAGRKDVVLIDSDTNSGWSAAGVAVEAKKEFRGKRLPPVAVEDELYWGVMKYWYPELQLAGVETGAAPTVIELNGGSAGNGAGAGGDASKGTVEGGEGAKPSGTVSMKPNRAVKAVAPRKKSP